MTTNQTTRTIILNLVRERAHLVADQHGLTVCPWSDSVLVKTPAGAIWQFAHEPASREPGPSSGPCFYTYSEGDTDPGTVRHWWADDDPTVTTKAIDDLTAWASR